MITCSVPCELRSSWSPACFWLCNTQRVLSEKTPRQPGSIRCFMGVDLKFYRAIEHRRRTEAEVTFRLSIY